MSDLQNYVYKMLSQVMHLINAYHLNVKGYVTPMKTAFRQDMLKMCGRISECLNSLQQRDASNSSEASSKPQAIGVVWFLIRNLQTILLYLFTFIAAYLFFDIFQ